jgi:iron complex transport system ATP-binding protein
MSLTVDDVSFTIEGARLLADIDVHVHRGETVGICGPNGSGKSTLLRSTYRLIAPDSGLVAIDGEGVQAMGSRALAKRMAVVLQERSSDFDFTVTEMVMLGRSPHKSIFERESRDDQQLCERSLAQVGMSAMAHRDFDSLSGGEKQRVLIARALAQQAEYVVLDEPTNHLDVRYQLETMDLVSALGVTVLVALHDLNIAAEYCDRIYLINHGRIVASGTPGEVFTSERVSWVFGVAVTVLGHPAIDRPLLVYSSAERDRVRHAAPEIEELRLA